MTNREARLLRFAFATTVLCVACGSPPASWAQETSKTQEKSAQADEDQEPIDRKADAKDFFRKRVTPFIKTYCLECHQNRRPTEAGLSFTPALDTPGHAAFSEKWKKSAARVKAHDMPPEGLDQPTDEEREMFLTWLQKVKYLSPKDPGPFVIRRLTKTEYGNTLHDLLGVDPSVADSLPDEVSGEGYLNSLSPLQLEQYLRIAESALDKVFGTPDASEDNGHKRPNKVAEIVGGFPGEESTGEEHRAMLETVAESLAKRAYRRPASDAEIRVLVDVYDLGHQNGLSDRAALRLMLKAMLVSPQFLFITPAVDFDTKDEIVPLDGYQLASRLSYLLWATMPDDELMSLADSGTLQEPAVLTAQVQRMLNDPRSRALFDGFAAQWLGLGDLQTKTFDPVKFPEMTDEMRSAMYDEARLFFASIVRENRSVADFIDSDYTFINEHLAAIYDLEDSVTGNEMRRIELADRNRGGVLGMPAILAATSFPNRTSPVNRGVWVLEQVLGDRVPPAPPDVPALENQDKQSIADLTLRERTELHRSDPVCANCHRLLDPIGFGLENFDAIGRWRDRDENGEAIDASGELPGGNQFASPRELKKIIAERLDDFSRNLVEKLLAYALCRKLEGYDEIVVDELMDEIAEDGYRMQTLINAVVTSYPFTHRRTE